MEQLACSSGGERLLSAGDPPPVEVRNPVGASPFVLLCEHAGRAVPAALRDRLPPPEDMDRHIAWDPGAGAVARSLADRLDAILVAQRYSRLVIDCNRPAGSAELVPLASDGSEIAFNQSVRPVDIDARWHEIHQPFQEAAAEALDNRKRPILVAVHSFTPRLKTGPERRFQLGLLSRREPSLALPLHEVLQGIVPDLAVRFNEPYRILDDSDYTIPVHAETRCLLHVLLEIRNDLITDAGAVEHWAALLADALPAAASRWERGESP